MESLAWIPDPRRRDSLFLECSRLKPKAIVSRLLREMFTEDTLAEYTYGGRKLNGLPTRGLSKDESTKERLELVKESALAFAPGMTDFGSFVNETCQRIRAKRKHSFEVVFYSADLNWSHRGMLYEQVSRLLHEGFERDVKTGREELKRRLDDFRNELAEADDERVERWNERYVERLNREPPLKIQRNERRKLSEILC